MIKVVGFQEMILWYKYGTNPKKMDFGNKKAGKTFSLNPLINLSFLVGARGFEPPTP